MAVTISMIILQNKYISWFMKWMLTGLEREQMLVKQMRFSS